MGKLLLVLALLAISAMLHAGYTEKLTVQVFDQSWRPVEGAAAYVEHQLNSVTGDVKTKPKLTNSSGLVDIIFTDYEEIPAETVYSYKLYVKYGDQLKTSTLIADNDSTKIRVVTVEVVSYVVLVGVHDQAGRPLDALVMIGDALKETDASGRAQFQLAPGDYDIKVDQDDHIITNAVTVDKDRAVDVSIGLYNLRVTVKDDKRQPLSATITAGGKTEQTDASGVAAFFNLTDQRPEVTAIYQESIKRLAVDLSVQNTAEFTFDLTKPSVKELHASVAATGGATVSVFVEDPGTQASGVDTVLVSYEVEGVENSLPAYAVGYNTFEAKVPPQKEGTLVKYTVKVMDKDGNIGFGTGTYFIPISATENETKPVQPVDQGFDAAKIPIETLLFGIVVVAIVGYGVVYYFRKRGEMAPPTTPPSIPQG